MTSLPLRITLAAWHAANAASRAVDVAALAVDKAICRYDEHLWDSSRPSGPIHERDICWRCGAIRP